MGINYMNKIVIKHVVPPSEAKTIREFLVTIDNVIIPKLSERVNINEYANKLSKSADLFYLLEGQKIVGNVAVYLNSKEKGYITSFAILSQYQKMGLGKRLFSEVRKEAEKRGIKCIDLEVYEDNEKAIKFYQKQGFVTENKREKWLKMSYIIG